MVDTWWARPSALEASARQNPPLSEAEVARMARFRLPADRDRFLSAWTLTRNVLGDRLGRNPADVVVTRQCEHCGHPGHGKPRIPGDPLHFSLSHADDRVLLAVSDVGPVGADVESLSRDISGIGGFVGHADEPEPQGPDLLRQWVRKEAVVKATGHGLAVAMNSFKVSAARQQARLLTWPTDPTMPGRTLLTDLPAPPGYLAATALIHPVAT